MSKKGELVFEHRKSGAASTLSEYEIAIMVGFLDTGLKTIQKQLAEFPEEERKMAVEDLKMIEIAKQIKSKLLLVIGAHERPLQ